ncbi:MAG: hypothetical protein EA407_04870 [Rhodobacteraceae bacterium]|nr:MAG: hypothetical protein EA407_04870 [Paracoccaceae bacterium]
MTHLTGDCPMQPDPVYNTDPRFLPKRPGVMPRLTADSRPGHPRNVAPRKPVVRYADWALI